MLALALLSTFGIVEFLGLGEKTDYYYICSHPSFFVTDDENQRTGDRYYTLKGVVATPQPGFAARFQFLNPGPPQAMAVLSLGQPVNPDGFGRGLPSVAQVQIEESFHLPERTGLLTVQVEGLTAMPTQFSCDLTKTSMQEPVQ